MQEISESMVEREKGDRGVGDNGGREEKEGGKGEWREI